MSVLILASGSQTRARILRDAGIDPVIRPARIDEEMLRAALVAEGHSCHDMADALAEAKALRVSGGHPDSLVLGCDQILEFEGKPVSKPPTAQDARAQLLRLRGKTHRLHSAAVLCLQGRPIWRHVSTARLTMRDFTDPFLDHYLAEEWPAIAESPGAYRIEERGIRLFSAIEGDHFAILGLPLLPLLAALARRGDIPA